MEVRSGKSVRRRIEGFNRPIYTDFNTDIDYRSFANIVDVPCYDITIPEDKFEELAEELEFFHNQTRQYQHAMDILKQAHVDERVRDSNPAVQKAYMRYIMLLEIARK